MLPNITTWLSEMHQQIAIIEEKHSDILTKCAEALEMLTTVDKKFKEWVRGNQFASQEEEITYFKYHRPELLAELIYYYRLYHIEANRPFGSVRELSRYYQKYLDRITAFYHDHREFIRYIRTGDTVFDIQFFTRHHINFRSSRESNFACLDQEQTTNYDYKLAKIRACEKLQQFLLLRIAEPVMQNQAPASGKASVQKPSPETIESCKGNLLKSYQVQKLLKMSEATLKRARQKGEIPFSKIGGTYYYDEDIIRKLLSDKMQTDHWKSI